MAFGKIHVADVGTVFEATIKDQDGVVVDISTASGRRFVFKKPDGTTFVKSGTLVNTGTDGKMKYTTESALILDQAGNWELQGEVDIGTGSWHTEIHRFRVYANLD